MRNYVFSFEEGSKEMKSLLGGKGANLSEMTNIGLPVPPGFTISTEACIQYFQDGQKINDIIKEQILCKIKWLESKAGQSFSNASGFFISVRSGASVSMPGMMDTILNLGLNDNSVEILSKKTRNNRFALDCYRRFIQMYGNVVHEVPHSKFELILEKIKRENSISRDTELEEEHLKQIIVNFKKLIFTYTGKPLEQDPEKQLLSAIEAVFKSWNNERAQTYRKINNIPDDLGTAVNIQSMVFGNMGDASGTGVVFSRNPSNGTKGIYGEFLLNAQGEDVVAGIRTPEPISELEIIFPEIYKELNEAIHLLEQHYKDMQDIEFTIQERKLYLLQTRSGKRTVEAALNIAVDMVREGVISKQKALLDFDESKLSNLLHPTFDKDKIKSIRELSSGLPACPGAASGKVYFNSEDVVMAKDKGIKAILVRTETSAEDINGMYSAEGILTSRGGMTSHAAVVARGMGKCCITNCRNLIIDVKQKFAIINDIKIHEGDVISIDGTSGKVYLGDIPTQQTSFSDNFNTFLNWADEESILKVFANADSPIDARKTIEFGAKGIGLCRTEHMFFKIERLMAVREMIFANSKPERMAALEKLFPFQKDDFVEIFKVMKEYPVSIRLLDPPLHEFLPKDKIEMENTANALNLSYEEVKQKVEDLSESNPMLGHRGCRLGITYPEIYEMQVRAIILAALETRDSTGISPKPEIMIPLVGSEKELSVLRERLEEVIRSTDKNSVLGKISIGTMIEVPRACIIADKIAEYADFFSFGTNDLTQMTFGYSRDDSGPFIKIYQKNKILKDDPFQVLDQNGVGELMKIAIEKGRKTNWNLKLGICGEHGGDTSSILFCHNLGLDYISCSPYRVPAARIAAAKAALASVNETVKVVLS